MKRYRSVLALAARGTVWKLLGIILAVGAAQGTLFVLWTRSYDPSGLSELYGGYYSYYGIEHMLIEGHIGAPAAAGFLLLCLALAYHGCDRSGSRSRYTLARLQVSRMELVLLWALCYALCLLVYWGFQAGMVLALGRLAVALGLASPDPLHFAVAFWRVDFAHSLLPMSDWTRLVCQLLWVPALALSASLFSHRQRQGGHNVVIFALTAIALVFFARPLGASTNYDQLFGLIALMVIIYVICAVWKEENYEL